jgi:hypothetical protein
MCRLTLFGLVAALVIGLVASDASACRRRKHCSDAFSCTNACGERDRAVTVDSASCAGGNGTYSSLDTKITAVYFERQGGGDYQCQFSMTKGEFGGTWKTTNVPTLMKGTYRLCAVGDKSGATCGSWFPCP